jgi:hypothetical protein
VPYALVEIRDEADNAVPIGQEKKIVAKVEGQMRGYWGDDELAASTSGPPNWRRSSPTTPA